MKSPVIESEQLVYENEYQQTYQIIANFGTFRKEYYTIETGVRAGLVVAKGDTILMVQQYRLFIDRLAWEIPGGRVDEGETPVEAAVRECLEETGVRCLNPRPLIFYHVGLEMVHNPTHLFYSNEVATHHEPEQIHAQEINHWGWLPLVDCIEMIFKQQIVDSFTIIALLAYQAMLKLNKK